MSFTDLSPNNNNSELSDDYLYSDDERSTVCDVDGSEKQLNNTNILKNKSEIPLKNDALCPEASGACAPPRCKKRKLFSFEELFKNLEYGVLYTNLTKLLFFLESDSNNCIFLLTKEYEEFFEMIVKDINILKSNILDADYRLICDKIINAAAGNLLFYIFEHRQEFHKKVMVINKVLLMDQSASRTASGSCSGESSIPRRLTLSKMETIDQSRAKHKALSILPSISSGFKMYCLRELLEFLKDDSIKTKVFPGLIPDQAYFMHLLLGRIYKNNFDKKPIVRELYAALVHAIVINESIFEFRIKVIDSWGGRKTVLFQKTPVQMHTSETATTSEPKADEKNQNLKKDIQNTEDPKINVLNRDDPKSQDLKMDLSKLDTVGSNCPKIEVLKPDVFETEAAKTDAPDSQAPKKDVPNSGATQTGVAEPCFEETKPLAQTKPQIREAKRAIRQQKQHENRLRFLKDTPKELIKHALKTILDFLQEDGIEKIILVPNTRAELTFYRKCIQWFKSDLDLLKFGEEFRGLHCRISHLLCQFDLRVTRKSLNVINKYTGIKEVTYLKSPKKTLTDTSTEAMETSDCGESQSSPMKRKVNVNNALELAASDLIKLDKVINLNQSLRRKKKDKKRKKAELKKAKAINDASEGAMTNQANSPTHDSTSSSSSSSRDSSKERMKAATEASFISQACKRPLSDISRSPKTVLGRQTGEMCRQEQLIEAMSVPVQSEKATRMMLGMGWNGGALGPRGEGITEPLMPKFEIAVWNGVLLVTEIFTMTLKPNRAGLGLIRKPETQRSDTVPSAQKTRRQLLEDAIFDITLKPSKQWKSNDELSKTSEGAVELLPSQTFSTVVQKRLPFRVEILHTLWELLNSDATSKSLKYRERITKKQRKFVNTATHALNSTKQLNYMFSYDEMPLCKKIREQCAESHFKIEASLFWDFKSIEFRKQPKKSKPVSPVMSEKNVNTPGIVDNTQVTSDEELTSYIVSMNGSTNLTIKTMKIMKFKILFLMNVLKFVKSISEEVEVKFNKVLGAKEKIYIENVVDEINMRIKFGSSRAETKLAEQIKEHVKDAFLGVMYNHEFIVVTLSKYFRFKRLNRRDNFVKRKSQVTVNLDDFTSETVLEPKLQTDKPIGDGDCGDKYEGSEVTESENTQVPAEDTTIVVSENEPLEVLPLKRNNEIERYDSDESNVEEYFNINANAKVPELLPGQEGVNISSFLYLYDKEKNNKASTSNKSIINNDSASNVTENRNSKNNNGNGNVVIDYNDNQFIDMKRGGDNAQDNKNEKDVDSEKADIAEKEVFESAETQIKIAGKEINIPENVKEDEENDQAMKHSDTVVANDAKIGNESKDVSDNILKPLYSEDLVIEDFESDNGCTENEAKDKIQSMSEVINNNEPMVVNNQDDSAEVINKDISEPIIVRNESMSALNTDESSKDIKVAQIKEGTSDGKNVKDDIVCKTECFKIKKENIVLSEEFCDTQAVAPSHVKSSEMRNVRIQHTDHPNTKLSAENVKIIQMHISNCIKIASELPLLKCHGVQNGTLFYTCHNKKTYDWLQNTVSVASYVKVNDAKEATKMALKLCGYFDFDSNYLFKMLEMYNNDISTKEWVVERTEKNGDYIFFIVKMDKFSIKFIQESDFALFAGIDKVHFNFVWE